MMEVIFILIILMLSILKKDKSIIFHKCEYGQKFVAAFEYNINGTQFHPEKVKLTVLCY